MKLEVGMKVIGHELVTVKERREAGTDANGRPVYETEEFDMLKVTLTGTGEDKKTKVSILVDPAERESYPLFEKGEVRFEIRQQRLPLDEGKKSGRAARTH